MAATDQCVAPGLIDSRRVESAYDLVEPVSGAIARIRPCPGDEATKACADIVVGALDIRASKDNDSSVAVELDSMT